MYHYQPNSCCYSRLKAGHDGIAILLGAKVWTLVSSSMRYEPLHHRLLGQPLGDALNSRLKRKSCLAAGAPRFPAKSDAELAVSGQACLRNANLGEEIW
jgi:hypothetical protein